MQRLQEMGVPSLGWQDPLGEEMEEEISSILAWRIHGQRSLAGYGPCGCKELAGLVAPWWLGSSQIRDPTPVSSIDRQVLYH